MNQIQKNILGGAALIAALTAGSCGLREGLQKHDNAESIRLEDHARMASHTAPRPGSLDLVDDVAGYYDENDNLAYVRIGNHAYQINPEAEARTRLGDGIVPFELRQKFDNSALDQIVIRINQNAGNFPRGGHPTVHSGRRYFGFEYNPISLNDKLLNSYEKRELFTRD